MAITPVSFAPSFKGLIYSQKDNVAVNVKYVTSMREVKDTVSLGEKITEVKLSDKSTVYLPAPLQTVLQKYERAAASEVYTIKLETENK